MPALVARTGEEGGAADDAPHPALVDELPALLVRAAEEGVGRRPHAQAPGPRGVDELLALGEGHAQRLFAMHVLAGGDGLQPHRDMGARNGEVDDDGDFGVGQQRLDRGGLEAELAGPRRGRLRPHIGDAPDVEDGKPLHRLDVGGRDVARPDDAHADLATFSHLPVSPLSRRSPAAGLRWPHHCKIARPTRQ